MKIRTFLGAACVLMLILGCTLRSAAQMGAGTFADVNLPSGALDPQEENSIWQVDPLTGALNVKIPFTTTPAGGHGPLSVKHLTATTATTLRLMRDTQCDTLYAKMQLRTASGDPKGFFPRGLATNRNSNECRAV